MKIIKFPDPILLKSCEEILEFDYRLLRILDSMWNVMKENDGIGLAANQIGLSMDAFVLDGPKGD